MAKVSALAKSSWYTAKAALSGRTDTTGRER
jgi:hypothetical protein